MPKPWTPGPWALEAEDDHAIYADNPKSGGYRELGWMWNDDDAALVALAPEMAELLAEVESLMKAALAASGHITVATCANFGTAAHDLLARARGEA